MAVRRSATAPDLPPLRASWRATRRDTHGAILGPRRLHLVGEALADPGVLGMAPPEGGGGVAVVGSEVAGSVRFAERHGRVWGICVLPRHRRAGAGRALLRCAGRDMPGARTLDLGTVTTAAEGF